MQRIPGLALLMLLATASLAGCADDPAATGATAGSNAAGNGVHGSHDAAMHLLAPNWTLGDWWTWSSPQIEGPYTSVLAEDLGAEWRMATDHPEIAWFNARFDIASLGEVRKSDLAGSQGATRVQFFQFPLTADKTWATTWDDQPITVLVTDVQDGVANLEARRADGTLYAAYTYEDANGYFGQITYYGADGTTVGFESEVTDNGNAFARDLVRWDFDVVFEQSGPIAGPGFAQNFPVPLTATDVYADLVVNCTAGTFTAGVAPMPVVTAFAGLDDRGAGTNDGACPLQTAFSGSAGEPRPDPTSGPEEQWGFSVLVGPMSAGSFTFNIYVRTLETFQVA